MLMRSGFLKNYFSFEEVVTPSFVKKKRFIAQMSTYRYSLCVLCALCGSNFKWLTARYLQILRKPPTSVGGSSVPFVRGSKPLTNIPPTLVGGSQPQSPQRTQRE